MPALSKNGAIAFGMFTLWRQVRIGANPPADGETCPALREELLKHGLKPKAKATKQELVIWVKTCWRVWRKYLLWKRIQFKNDPRKLEMDDQLRIAQTGAPSFAMSLSLREEMRTKMAAAKTAQERDNISHNYRAAGDPFYNYFPPRLEPPEGSKKVIVPFKAGNQVMLGDLVREGKVEHRAKFARYRAEDLAAARKAEHAIEALKYDAMPLTGHAMLEVPPANPRPFKKPIAWLKKKRSPLRKTPSPRKTDANNEASPTIDPETFMVLVKTQDMVAPHVYAEPSLDAADTPDIVAPQVNVDPQRTPKFIDLEPDDPSSQNEGGFMAESPPSSSKPYFDLTGDDAPVSYFTKEIN